AKWLLEAAGLTEQRCPAFNLVGAPFGFPLFQRLVIAALGFNHFAVMGVLVLLDAACALAGSWSPGGALRLAGTGFGIEQSNDIAQGFLILTHEFTQFAFELQFLLQLVVCRERLQAFLKLLDSFFGSAVFVDK